MTLHLFIGIENLKLIKKSEEWEIILDMNFKDTKELIHFLQGLAFSLK